MSTGKRYDSYLEMPREELLTMITEQADYVAEVTSDLILMQEALRERDANEENAAPT